MPGGRLAINRQLTYTGATPCGILNLVLRVENHLSERASHMAILIGLNSELTARVVHGKGPSNKVKTITYVTILADGVEVAGKRLSGDFDRHQALADFKRNHKVYTKLAGYEAAVGIGLV